MKVPAILHDSSRNMAGDSDLHDKELADLLARCGLRDQNALKILYRRVAAKMNGVALRITGSRDIAEDVLQEGFVQIWNSAASYRPDLARPMTWITAIIRHRALDRQKLERKHEHFVDRDVELEMMHLASPDTDPLTHFFLQEAKGGLINCMKRLSASQQRAVLFAYYYGHTQEEIAGRLSVAAGTVKSWLHRGVKRLRQCLQR